MSAGNLPARPNLPATAGHDQAEPGAVVVAPDASPPVTIDAGFEVAQAGAGAGQSMGAPPILGALTVIFGVTSLYQATLLLAPLAIVLGGIAVLRRRHARWGWIGIGAAAAALAITPAFWALIGLAWALQRYGWILDYLTHGS